MNTFVIDIDCLYCPITKQIYNEPVIAADGFIYEKDALIEWFKNHNTSPKINKIIDNIYLSCFLMKQHIEEYLLKHPDKLSEQYENSVEDMINDNKDLYCLINKNIKSIDLSKIDDLEKFFSIKSDKLLKKFIDNIIDLMYDRMEINTFCV